MVDNHTQMPQPLNNGTKAAFCWRFAFQLRGPQRIKRLEWMNELGKECRTKR